MNDHNDQHDNSKGLVEHMPVMEELSRMAEKRNTTFKQCAALGESHKPLGVTG